MKKAALIAPILILGYFTYWGFAWFCSDWGISNAPMRSLLGILPSIGEPAFCNLAVIGSIAFPIYVIVFFKYLRRL